MYVFGKIKHLQSNNDLSINLIQTIGQQPELIVRFVVFFLWGLLFIDQQLCKSYAAHLRIVSSCFYCTCLFTYFLSLINMLINILTIYLVFCFYINFYFFAFVCLFVCLSIIDEQQCRRISARLMMICFTFVFNYLSIYLFVCLLIIDHWWEAVQQIWWWFYLDLFFCLSIYLFVCLWIIDHRWAAV